MKTNLYKLTIATDRFGSTRCVTVEADTVVQAVGQIRLYENELLIGCEILG